MCIIVIAMPIPTVCKGILFFFNFKLIFTSNVKNVTKRISCDLRNVCNT